jgi:hypothetical protein
MRSTVLKSWLVLSLVSCQLVVANGEKADKQINFTTETDPYPQKQLASAEKDRNSKEIKEKPKSLSSDQPKDPDYSKLVDPGARIITESGLTHPGTIDKDSVASFKRMIDNLKNAEPPVKYVALEGLFKGKDDEFNKDMKTWSDYYQPGALHDDAAKQAADAAKARVIQSIMDDFGRNEDEAKTMSRLVTDLVEKQHVQPVAIESAPEQAFDAPLALLQDPKEGEKFALLLKSYGDGEPNAEAQIRKELSQYVFSGVILGASEFTHFLGKDNRLTSEGLDRVMAGLKIMKDDGFKFDSNGKPFSQENFLQNVTDWRTEMMAKEIAKTLDDDPSGARMLVSVGGGHLGFNPKPTNFDGHTYESLNLLLRNYKYNSTIFDFGTDKAPGPSFHAESG